jgi:hypothetical protein
MGRLDRVVKDLHRAATKRGLDGRALDGMSPVQLTGSSVCRLPAADRMGMPAFDDVDLRMVGVTFAQLTAALQRHFPELAPDSVTLEPSYLKGVLHAQVRVRRRQLDMSLYQSAEGYTKPHQRLTMAALKLNLDSGRRLSQLLPLLTSRARAAMLRDRGILVDPGGTGLEDAHARVARLYHVPGMDPRREPEGLLHAAYWAGNTVSPTTVDPDTMEQFRRLSQKDLRRFFREAEPSVAQRRRNYVFSILRVRRGRDPVRVIDLLKEAEAVGKLFPGLDEVAADSERWARTRLRVAGARDEILRAVRGRDERGSRETIMGALLSGVDDVEAALANFRWARRAVGSDFSKARVIAAWRRYRG